MDWYRNTHTCRDGETYCYCIVCSGITTKKLIGHHIIKVRYFLLMNGFFEYEIEEEGRESVCRACVWRPNHFILTLNNNGYVVDTRRG